MRGGTAERESVTPSYRTLIIPLSFRSSVSSHLFPITPRLLIFICFASTSSSMPPKGAKGGKSKVSEASTAEAKVFQTRSSKAGLQFPVGRIHRYLKQRTQNNVRIGAKAAVYTSAILEYLTAEVLELAGPPHLSMRSLYISLTLLGIQATRRRISELDTLVRATIAGGGVLPFIHKSLTLGKAGVKKPDGMPA
ncbi:histone-fold-containing protein [Russula compacta]|nr:histone-fold-containing protein [Russula compacta]